MPDPGYSVHTADGRDLYIQVNKIPDHVAQLPGRNSTAIYELIFRLNDVPAMGKQCISTKQQQLEQTFLGYFNFNFDIFFQACHLCL